MRELASKRVMNTRGNGNEPETWWQLLRCGGTDIRSLPDSSSHETDGDGTTGGGVNVENDIRDETKHSNI